MIKDYSLDNPVRKHVLMLLAIDVSVPMNAFQIEAALRYFDYLGQSECLQLISGEVDGNLEALTEYGFIDETDNGYVIDEDGKKASALFLYLLTLERRRHLLWAKRQITLMTKNELCLYLSHIIPEALQYSEKIKHITTGRKKIINSMFEKGAISSLNRDRWMKEVSEVA